MAENSQSSDPVELPPQGIYPGREVSDEGDTLIQWILQRVEAYRDDLDFTINIPNKVILVEGSGWNMKAWRNFLEGIYHSNLGEDCPTTTMDMRLTIRWDQVPEDPEESHHCDELQGVRREN